MNKENVITLDNPVKRGEQVIEQVTLMKPNAGTLRGVSLAAVANSEVDALIKVLPRMTAPMLTEQEVAALELPDLVALGELFTPLKPVFDWLGEKLQAAWQWFKNLIAPVKATQDTLNRCRDTGVMFGQALADALMLPLNAFNKLRSGIDWVLEKLGVINKESDALDQTAARTHAATYGTGGYIPATSSYAGYQAYQPVTAPAGRSYVDQSKNEYHINLTGGTAPGTQLDRQLQDALEKYERDKRARARASMMHDG
ncbi:phage tail assembly protein [Escherichia coli]|nr:phage tail assembly protein [Escherichia coli]